MRLGILRLSDYIEGEAAHSSLSAIIQMAASYRPFSSGVEHCLGKTGADGSSPSPGTIMG